MLDVLKHPSIFRNIAHSFMLKNLIAIAECKILLLGRENHLKLVIYKTTDKKVSDIISMREREKRRTRNNSKNCIGYCVNAIKMLEKLLNQQMKIKIKQTSNIMGNALL